MPPPRGRRPPRPLPPPELWPMTSATAFGRSSNASIPDSVATSSSTDLPDLVDISLTRSDAHPMISLAFDSLIEPQRPEPKSRSRLSLVSVAATRRSRSLEFQPLLLSMTALLPVDGNWPLPAFDPDSNDICCAATSRSRSLELQPLVLTPPSLASRGGGAQSLRTVATVLSEGGPSVCGPNSPDCPSVVSPRRSSQEERSVTLACGGGCVASDACSSSSRSISR